MSAIADGLDFLMDLFQHNAATVRSGTVADRAGMQAGSAIIFLLMLVTWLVVFQEFARGDFSATITASAMVQTFGFCILSIRVRVMKSVNGISSKTCLMTVIFLCVRLCATTLKRGYVPRTTADANGYFFYQIMDICTVVLASHLVYCCHKTFRHTYQEEHDTLPLVPLILPAFVLSYFINSNLNRSPFFDYIWFTSMNLETVAMVPQLWMMSKIGGKITGISSQFVACVVVSKVIAFTFWVYAYPEVSKRNPDDPTNVAGKQIIGAFGLQLFFVTDFMFYYVKSLLEGTDSVELPQATGLEM